MCFVAILSVVKSPNSHICARVATSLSACLFFVYVCARSGTIHRYVMKRCSWPALSMRNRCLVYTANAPLEFAALCSCIFNATQGRGKRHIRKLLFQSLHMSTLLPEQNAGRSIARARCRRAEGRQAQTLPKRYIASKQSVHVTRHTSHVTRHTYFFSAPFGLPSLESSGR